ncbi:hypothetical protein ACFSRY_10805 [Pontibacter locisalis]|uniref:Lipoprotein n=1 Tax=Pontibacter locisalis TaxID=1719035 RepID=A0ABW5IL23_9BACT
MINYLYPMLLVLLLWQCNDKDIEPHNKQVNFGETFTFKQGEEVVIVGEGEDLLLQLYSINDSRCPTDAICVWLGNATVILKASNTQEKEKELQMCIGDCRPEPARTKHILSAIVGGVDYKITLKEVSPYPALKESNQVKQVKLVVERDSQ